MSLLKPGIGDYLRIDDTTYVVTGLYDGRISIRVETEKSAYLDAVTYEYWDLMVQRAMPDGDRDDRPSIVAILLAAVLVIFGIIVIFSLLGAVFP